MLNITQSNVIQILLQYLPQFRSQYELHISNNRKVLLHLLLAELITYIKSTCEELEVKMNSDDNQILRNFADFIELMANSSDNYIRNAVYVSCFESFNLFGECQNDIEALLGQVSRQMLQDIRDVDAGLLDYKDQKLW